MNKWTILCILATFATLIVVDVVVRSQTRIPSVQDIKNSTHSVTVCPELPPPEPARVVEVITTITPSCEPYDHDEEDDASSEEEEEDTAPSPTPETNRAAVCVSGQLRTLTIGLDHEFHPGTWNHMSASIPDPNMTVAESVQRNLFPKFDQVDVFMYIATRETEREPKAGDLSVCEPLRPPNDGHLECEVPLEEDLLIFRRETLWSRFLLVYSERQVQGLLQQLYGMVRCFKQIELHSHRTGIKYDWVVRLRPDLYVYDFPHISKLASFPESHNTIFYANRQACCCGNEDTFGIGRYHLMAPYFDRYYSLQLRENLTTGTWTAEDFVKAFLKDREIRLEPVEDIKTCPVKPTNRRAGSDP